MKNLVFLAVLLFIVPLKSNASDPAPGERSIGFATALPDTRFHLGTEKAIQVVKDLDKVWSERDYSAMKKFFVDTAKCFFPDGTVTHSPEEFVTKIKNDSEGSEVSWTFDYAYSVDLDPTRGGEHVQAGFTGTSVKDGVTTKKGYHESYYIIKGKIVMWNQYTMNLKKD